MVNCQGKISVISGYVILKNRMKSYAASKGNEMTEIHFQGVLNFAAICQIKRTIF